MAQDMRMMPTAVMADKLDKCRGKSSTLFFQAAADRLRWQYREIGRLQALADELAAELNNKEQKR